MLYNLLYPLKQYFAPLNILRYITFRSISAVITAFLITLIIGPYIINWLEKKQVRQVIRDDGPEEHFKKRGTPTMGGLMMLISITISVILWSDMTNKYVYITLFALLTMGLLGFADDYKKVKEASSKGISGRIKLVVQGLVGLIIGYLIYSDPSYQTGFAVPFLKFVERYWSLGFLMIPFVILVISATSNAVNLTDGLDGLAIGPVMSATAVFAILCYATGNVKIANYLQIPYVSGVGELSVFCSAMIGAGMGFLWFNAYPALVFMGDTGSLSLGAALGVIALLSKHPFLLILAGGIFVAEATSVIVQVISFKLTGKRIFRMAPIHHHFEKKGGYETHIVIRFWIASAILALLSLATLKLR
ncbi:MAG: phospho-N-acetylmuramoyl-pentapeptide-transferase [bacterium]